MLGNLDRTKYLSLDSCWFHRYCLLRINTSLCSTFNLQIYLEKTWHFRVQHFTRMHWIDFQSNVIVDWNILFATSCRCCHSQNDGYILLEGKAEISSYISHNIESHFIFAESGFAQLLQATIKALAVIANLHIILGHVICLADNCYRYFALRSNSVS